MVEPISPAPVTEHGPDYLPAYVANGVIGLRVRDIPLRRGSATVNGLSATHPVELVECSPFAPYPLKGDIKIGHVWLSDVWHQAHFIEQSYDFSCGELHSRFSFTADGVEARVRVLTFCSRPQPSLALQEVEVEFSKACDAVLCAAVEPIETKGRWHVHSTLPGDTGSTVDGVLLWEPEGDLSACGVAYSTEFVGDADGQSSKEHWGEQGALVTNYSFKAVGGTRYRLRQIASLVPSTMHHHPDVEAARRVAFGRQIGWDALREDNRAAWRELWKGRVQLLGATRRWQALADAAFFYMQSSVHPSSHASTHIFGLGRWYNYHYYYGHVMWDIETFSIPAILFTQPDAAEAMLEYRSRSIPAARQNAALYGYPGLQYPWQSGPARGEEATPLSGQGSSYEQHVGLSVAHAFAQHYYATGNERFLRSQGWPVLAGVAEWLTSRAVKTGRGYEIQQMMGAAERKKPSDNVAYVNMAASVVLREAADCAKRLGYAAPSLWDSIADQLVVSISPKTHVIRAHDDYRPDEELGATPGPPAALLLFGYPVDKAVEQATLRFYVDIADKYIGTPMLSAFYGVWAAQLGDRARSATLFEEGYAKFVSERFMNTHELREQDYPDRPPAGPFFANIGGFLVACLNGLTGVRAGPGEPDTWCERPVVMPDGWDGVEVERIWVRGQAAHLVARHGDERAQIEIAH